MSGFVVIQRDALDHHVIGDARHFYPWCWLIANACWKATKFNVRGKTITLERGQICVSVRQLADAWSMSKSAVDRFLTRLETETMIGREAGHGRLVLTIRNYSKYQDIPADRRDTSGTSTGTPAGHQRDTKEQGNHLGETSEPNGSSVSRDCETVIAAWNAMASANGLSRCTKLSAARKKSCIARLRDDGLETILKAIEHVPRSSFLLGLTGGWSGADIEFLLRPDSVTKILEGKYDDRPKQPGPSGSRPFDGRDGVAKALDRQLGFEEPTGPTGRCDAGEGGDYLALPAPRLAAVR